MGCGPLTTEIGAKTGSELLVELFEGELVVSAIEIVSERRREGGSFAAAVRDERVIREGTIGKASKLVEEFADKVLEVVDSGGLRVGVMLRHG